MLFFISMLLFPRAVFGFFMPLPLPTQIVLTLESPEGRLLTGTVTIDHYFLKGVVAYAADMHGMIDGAEHNMTFIGLNHLLSHTVDRYLIVDDDCSTFTETLDAWDPFAPIMDRFQCDGDECSYSNEGVTASMSLRHGIERSAKVNTKRGVYSASYGYKSTFIDTRVFRKHLTMTCATVDSDWFSTSPFVQISDWLVLEYPLAGAGGDSKIDVNTTVLI